MGIAYKPNIDDAREPCPLVMQEVAKGSIVLYHDPYIDEVTDEKGNYYKGEQLTDELLSSVDCVVFTTNHDCFDVEHIVENLNL